MENKTIDITEMVFDLDTVEVPVKVGNNEYILREATGSQVAKWKSFIVSNTRIKNGAAAGVNGNISTADALLVSLCLKRIVKQPTEIEGQAYETKEVKVDKEEVLSWPARISTALFEKAKEISDIKDEDKEDDEGE